MKYNVKKYTGIFLSLSLALALIIAPIASGSAQALSTISASLGIGSSGADVTTLQTFLAQDSSIYPQGLVTGYYGTLTAAAVSRFQAQNGLDQVGRVGPLTRAKINAMITGGTTGGSTTAGPGQAPSIMNVTTALGTATSGTSTTTDSNGATTTVSTTSQGLVVSWQTDRPTRGKVFYSTTPIVTTETSSPTAEPTIGGFVTTDDTLTSSKSVTIPNLWANGASTSYYYMIEAIDANGYVSVIWPRTVNSSGTSSQ